MKILFFEVTFFATLFGTIFGAILVLFSGPKIPNFFHFLRKSDLGEIPRNAFSCIFLQVRSGPPKCPKKVPKMLPKWSPNSPQKASKNFIFGGVSKE